MKKKAEGLSAFLRRLRQGRRVRGLSALSPIAASVLDVPQGTPASATTRSFAQLEPFPRRPKPSQEACVSQASERLVIHQNPPRSLALRCVASLLLLGVRSLSLVFGNPNP
jgi:hypothetical protein